MWFALTKFIANLDNFKKFQNVFADCKWNHNLVFSDFLLFYYRISNFIILGNSLQDNIMFFFIKLRKMVKPHITTFLQNQTYLFSLIKFCSVLLKWWMKNMTPKTRRIYFVKSRFQKHDQLTYRTSFHNVWYGSSLILILKSLV